MKNPFYVFLLLFLILNPVEGVTQNIHINSRFEKISVQKDTSFVKEITITIKNSDEQIFYPIFYDTELEKVSDIQLFVKKGKRFKQVSIINIHEEDVELDYITSKKVKSVEIPLDKEVKLTYTVKCNELMYFSSLYFFSNNKIDTLKYQVIVPDKFEFVHNTIYKDSLAFYAIDSTKIANSTEWNIKVAPKKVEPDLLQFFGIYKNMKVPLMRTLVIPSSYKNQPTKYMNDWYYKKVSRKKELNTSVKRKIDELTLNVTDPMQLVEIIYSYVKSNFKYVAIEIGMGAFIPTHANEVYLNKQGDCKDLSNFLSSALNYKGVKSDIALAATFDHISNCDFPSLSSANHVICIVYINDKAVLLDPTDPIHFEETPVQSLQDRTILIVNSEGGLFFDVEGFSPEQNEINYQMNLKADSKNMLLEGTFDVKYRGISGNFLQRELKSLSNKEFENFGDMLYEEIFGNQSISDLTITSDLNEVSVDGKISINGKTFKDGPNQYLFLDFIPRLMETESRETLLEGTYLRNPFHKKASIRIEMDEPIKKFEIIEHTYAGEGVSLHLKISAISDFVIECNYNFVFDHIFINKENIDITNEILKSFKKIINEPVVFKKKNS